MSRTIHEQIGERRLTPMLKQFVDAKENCPDDAILLFRMGDFYELFFDDACVAAEQLDLTLTSRDKDRNNPIPMAGVPHHAVNGYIAKLVERGFTVAICDQVEDPKIAKGIVKREVTRLITPGTISELEALDPLAANYLACALQDDSTANRNALVMLDMLAGEILCTNVGNHELLDELERMGVREILVDTPNAQRLRPLQEFKQLALRLVNDQSNDGLLRKERICERFGDLQVKGREQILDKTELAALDALLDYVDKTQRRKLEYLSKPRAYRRQEFVILDRCTRSNLELLRTNAGDKRGSLFWHLNQTRTSMGARLLSHWMLFPLRDPKGIETRLEQVETFHQARALRKSLQDQLQDVRDIERLVGRLAISNAHPKDLSLLRDSLERVPYMAKTLVQNPSSLGRIWNSADQVIDVHELLTKALVDLPPTHTRDGGIFRRGYCTQLDELIVLSTESHDYLHRLERRERERTGINTLKVRYNRVFGYYIEVGRAHSHKVPDDYVRKQTLVNAERFITEELKTYEVTVLGADERRKTCEQDLFEKLVHNLREEIPRLRRLARLIAQTDAILSLAQVADEHRYVRPKLVDDGTLSLHQSRHPVLERLMPGGERFVPNDIELDRKTCQLWMLTGPNMSGKSTLMRQVALGCLMAHMGSFVPASKASLGLVDRIFTRVGASDHLGRGQSTFMVEMVETATILREASEDSLVILDEIGRGTSTYDGVSIAWAVTETLHDTIGCLTLFATHYHELAQLACQNARIVNRSIDIKQDGERIVFLRRLVNQAADRSYGIEVAQLAGVPVNVLQRARAILGNLEQGDTLLLDPPARRSTEEQENAHKDFQTGLFTEEPHANHQHIEDVIAKLKSLKVSEMTPLEALNLLDHLHTMLHEF
jgi:DNA mismatch repair protein MutS